ncbi:hypothetical protein J1605_020342 [Eschrichtius robustus]|uniref:C1q domain-containing protein n=1 Tax=Eschrichtius robustus TaxID=9764 RepID=A0AB34HKU1_ESCRO|nr:hypothetical protein J1605_020342 [Eschrichtius robustus]
MLALLVCGQHLENIDSDSSTLSLHGEDKQHTRDPASFWLWALFITSAPADLKTEGNSEPCEPCTTPGVYNFAFDNELFQRSVKIGLMRNGIQVRWKQAQAKDSHKHALGTVIVHLEKEDKVWLESKLNEAESEKGTTQIMFFGGHGCEPWSGKIPHATEQLSPCATTTEPALCSPRATTTDPVRHTTEGRTPRACTPQQEKPSQ